MKRNRNNDINNWKNIDKSKLFPSSSFLLLGPLFGFLGMPSAKILMEADDSDVRHFHIVSLFIHIKTIVITASPFALAQTDNGVFLIDIQLKILREISYSQC